MKNIEDAKLQENSTIPPKKIEFHPGFTKTPLFHAMHAARYMRQDFIRKIQEITKTKLICYVAGSSALIHRDDTMGIVDLLHNLGKNQPLDLLLNTPGGDMDAAEKFISIIRAKVGSAQLRIIIPDYAKSSGTLIATGADVIAMSDTSELGPIDPQITLNDGHGNFIPHSVQSYLDAYQFHVEALTKNKDDIVAQIMLGKLDPATVKLFEAARSRARVFAEDQLKRGMLQKNGNYTAVAGSLIDTKRWLSHGQVIGHEDATEIGLNIEYMEPRSEAWSMFWQLYTMQKTAVSDREKLFESDCASLTMES